jgi:hypothetical protein
MPDVTRLLEAAAAGDRQAAAEILPLVYDELRKLAAAKMACEKPDHTLNATAVVSGKYVAASMHEFQAAEADSGTGV